MFDMVYISTQKNRKNEFYLHYTRSLYTNYTEMMYGFKEMIKCNEESGL